MTIDNIAFILIIVSALFKGVALRNLSNTEWEMAKRKKIYWKWNILCYIFLVPGAALLIYYRFFM
ncbi:MAG: hypothetical protein DBX41_02830 [Clostridiales bacterium]|nr:MAG: hypothetical protein DBX41_02830 [Clostridiales bacterium]